MGVHDLNFNLHICDALGFEQPGVTHVLLSTHSMSPPKFQRRVWISVGTLPLLRVGDIWRDGQLDVRPDYALEEFPDIQIDKNTTTLIKAGLNLDDKGFLLPLPEHPWHMQCTQSYCVMVESHQTWGQFNEGMSQRRTRPGHRRPHKTTVAKKMIPPHFPPSLIRIPRHARATSLWAAQ